MFGALRRRRRRKKHHARALHHKRPKKHHKRLARLKRVTKVVLRRAIRRAHGNLRKAWSLIRHGRIRGARRAHH